MTDLVTVGELRFERVLDASMETVWRYIVDPALRERWFMSGGIEPRVGGTIEFVMDHDKLSDEDVPMPERFAPYKGNRWSEKIVAIEPPQMIAFEWENGKAGVVTIELTALTEGTTRLNLVHTGLRGVDDARNFGGGWKSHLAVLQARIEGEPIPDFWALHALSEASVSASLSAQQRA